MNFVLFEDISHQSRTSEAGLDVAETRLHISAEKSYK